MFEPWLTVRAATGVPYASRWGPEIKFLPKAESNGAWKHDPPLKELSDIDRLVRRPHTIDEAATAVAANKLRDAVGDILAVNVDHSPYFWVWGYDLSTDLGYLRGIEPVMWDMTDNPKWLHRLMAFMRDTVLAMHDQAERAGHITRTSTYNQAMPYAQELPDPGANSAPVTRKQIWAFSASQELTLVSPGMHEEFMLRYQIPIMEKFGLSSYGCCEDLTENDILRKVSNLRRIAVAPRANVRRCAEQIGTDYVFSYRPNPALMVSCGFDPVSVRTIIHNDLAAARHCHVDITLKDVETVENDPTRIREWVRVVREVIEE